MAKNNLELGDLFSPKLTGTTSKIVPSLIPEDGYSNKQLSMMVLKLTSQVAEMGKQHSSEISKLQATITELKQKNTKVSSELSELHQFTTLTKGFLDLLTKQFTDHVEQYSKHTHKGSVPIISGMAAIRNEAGGELDVLLTGQDYLAQFKVIEELKFKKDRTGLSLGAVFLGEPVTASIYDGSYYVDLRKLATENEE